MRISDDLDMTSQMIEMRQTETGEHRDSKQMNAGNSITDCFLAFRPKLSQNRDLTSLCGLPYSPSPLERKIDEEWTERPDVMDAKTTPAPLFGPLVSPASIDDETPAHNAQPPQPRVAVGHETLLPVASVLPRAYLCPGEKHPIPRSIHLARLAAFYPNCRQCEHRTDTGHLPRSMIGRIEQTSRRGEQASFFLQDGVRGAYLNHLTRKIAGQIAAAFAERVWSEKPLVGRARPTDIDELPIPPRHRAGPSVVIGQDARPSSPDLSVGVSESLRLMGCEVIDVGLVSRPCLSFAVDHLQADGGLFVTGSGCPPAWTGLDLVGAGGIPCSLHGTLADIERRYRSGVSRPTRQGGSQRYFDAAVPYRASLLKHFQAGRPQKLVCCCHPGVITDTLQALMEPLPAEVIWKHEATETAAGRLAAIKAESADWGVVISEDGTAIRLFDHDGRPVPEADLRRRILSVCGYSDELITGDDPETGSESLARRIQEQATSIGVQTGGRFWYRDAFPRCDAAITLGHLLRSPA